MGSFPFSVVSALGAEIKMGTRNRDGPHPTTPSGHVEASYCSGKGNVEKRPVVSIRVSGVSITPHQGLLFEVAWCADSKPSVRDGVLVWRQVDTGKHNALASARRQSRQRRLSRGCHCARPELHDARLSVVRERRERLCSSSVCALHAQCVRSVCAV